MKQRIKSLQLNCNLTYQFISILHFQADTEKTEKVKCYYLHKEKENINKNFSKKKVVANYKISNGFRE